MRTNSNVHLPSLGMLILSGGGALLAVSSAGGLFLAGFFVWLTNSTGASGAQVFFSFGWTAALQFVLLLPASILAGLRLLDQPLPEWKFNHGYLFASGGLLLVPIALGLGILITRVTRLAELILPFISLAVVSLPLVWLIFMGTRGFSEIPFTRAWETYSFSTLISIPFILVFEVMVLLAIGIGAAFWLGMNSPEIVHQLTSTLQRLSNANMDTETVLRILRPYIKQPVVVVGGLAITSGVVPLLEEFLKPLALWFFAPRKLSPRDGFIIGMVCGASFALLESLGALANPALEAWPILAVGRIGTGILHTTTSGLVGWGLATAWQDGKYGKLAAAYAAAVIFHGVWNIFGLAIGLEDVSHLLDVQSPIIFNLIQISPFVLILLSGLLISIVRRANILLQNSPEA